MLAPREQRVRSRPREGTPDQIHACRLVISVNRRINVTPIGELSV